MSGSPRNFAPFCHLHWKAEAEAAHEYFKWLESQARLQPIFKYWGAFLLGDIEKGFDYLEKTDFNALTVRAGSVRHLPQSTTQKVLSHPGHRDMMESFGMSDQWRDELITRVNELTPITGIEVKPDREY